MGRTIEGVFDQVADQLKQAGPPPDPEQMRQQIEGQVKQQVQMDNAGKDIALNKRAADLDIREMKFTAQQEIARAKQDADSARQEAERVKYEYRNKAQQDQALGQVKDMIGQHEMHIEKAVSQEDLREQRMAEQAQKAEQSETSVQEIKELLSVLQEGLQGVVQMVNDLQKQPKLKAANKVRDKSGRLTHLERVYDDDSAEVIPIGERVAA